MTQQTTLEIIGESVEEAIESGLSELGLSIDDVEVETLDEGSKGLFGLGLRQARIRLIVKSAKKAKVTPTKPIKEPKKVIDTPRPSTVKDIEEPELKVTRETVSELLEKMQVTGQVTSTFVEKPEKEEEPGVLVEVTGEDLSILIGRRSETLNALQYVTSLIVGRRLGRWIPVMIDVEGYRARREHQLHQLALRMADQAILTGRRQVLEPMPANERRIIHIALRDHPQVTTESTGEEPNRKLTIILKK